MSDSKQQHVEKECPLRTYQCEHCGIGGSTYKDIRTQHYAKRFKYLLQCPKDCSAVVKICDLKAHKNEYPLEVVCPYLIVMLPFCGKILMII